MHPLAPRLIDALDHARPLQPLGEMALGDAYALAEELESLRQARGEQVAGYKIGFTNAALMNRFGVEQPIWGRLYAHTTVQAAEYNIATFLEPRIEPEIVVRLGESVPTGADEAEILGAISHIGLGFELVQSFFAGWQFAATDVVAGFASHGALVHGALEPLAPQEPWTAALQQFSLTLTCDGAVVEEGVGANVMGTGPLTAVRALLTGLASRGLTTLPAGTLITTGSLTQPHPITPGQVWEMQVAGLALAAPSLRLALAPAP